MTVAFGPSLSQKDPALRPFDIDDCWVVAALQCARGVGGSIEGITIPVFRKAAGRPDNPNQTNPGGAADVIRGSIKLWPKLRITQASTSYDTYRAALVKKGKLSVLLVDSGRLPDELQYGFRGLHAVSVRFVATSGGGAFYIVNPLQPKGTKAQRIDEPHLKGAALAYPAGVQAVLYGPEAAPPPPAPVPDDTPYSQADLDDAYDQGRADGIQAAIDAAEALL